MYRMIVPALLVTVQVFCNQYPQRYEGIKLYEEALGQPLEVIAKFIPDDPVIFEAGGHYGEDTVRFAARWPKGKVISFEANPHAFELLNQTTREISNIFGYNLAVNNYNGQATLHVCYGTTGDNPVFEGASSLLEASDWQAVHYKGPKVVVPCVVLDDWCEEQGVDHIDFMWLDLEGLELQILQSSPRILDSLKVLYTETNFLDFRKGMTQYSQLKSFLEESGFKLLAHWYAQGFQGNAIFIKKEPFEN
jgi:FkbM family methyltransferase